MLLDNSSLSYNNNITDWQLGDDRIFTRSVAASSLPVGDSLTDGYLTLKTNPTDVDANSLVQKHITRTLTIAGQITGSPALSLLFNVYSVDYEGLISSGPVVYYDIRVLTLAGHTYTVETGSIEFQQNVTQANIGGTPASLRSNGQPQFQGFTATKPDQTPINIGLFNAGDFYINSNPINGLGAGWECTIGGSPGTWVTIGTIPTGVIIDLHFKGYASAAPLVGTFVAADYFLNIAPASGAPEGWVCIAGGIPGTWRTKGIIGDT